MARQSADTTHHYGPPEWAMTVAVALVWGSSFLWIRLALDHVSAPVVALARCVFGSCALALVPGARRPIERTDRARVFGIGLLWMGIPFLMFPLAEGWGHVSTAVTGMINGGLPLVSAVVAAAFARTWPSRRRVVALLIGFAGMALIAAPALGSDASAGLGGLGALAVALIGYALSANLARPYQAKYSSPQLMLRLTLSGAIWSTPLGLWGLGRAVHRATPTLASIGALVVLGCVGTGLAFWAYGVLLLRAGPVRGMIAIFFTPIVGVVLGLLVRDEHIAAVAFGGMALVIVGALLTSRPDARPVADVRATRSS